jgi:single-stranded DNA-binding protein
MNVVSMTGRLVSDVAHRQVDGHGAVAEFRFALDGRKPIYLTVETWGHSAGKAASHLTKGRRVAITGRWRNASSSTATTTDVRSTTSSATTSPTSTRRPAAPTPTRGRPTATNPHP